MSLAGEMIMVLAAMVLFTAASSQNIICGECRSDQHVLCGHSLIKAYCNATAGLAMVAHLKCPMTCRPADCPPCQGQGVNPRSCVGGVDVSCKDDSKRCGLIAALQLCNKGNLAFYFQSKCRKSCGLCRPSNCQNPFGPRSQECSPDCFDKLPACKALAEHRFCFQSNVRDSCPVSCNTGCRPCPLPFGASQQTGLNQAQVLRPSISPGPFFTNAPREFTTERTTLPIVKQPITIEPLTTGPTTSRPTTLQTTTRTTRQSTTSTIPPTTTEQITTTTQPETIEIDLALCARRYGKTSNLAMEAECLVSHNYYRCIHGAQPLKYDTELQETALDYAIKLADSNSQEESRNFEVYPSQVGVDRPSGVGENVQLGTPLQDRYTISDAVTAWYAEGLNYDYERSEITPETSYFTQLIWKDTTHVGCAIVKEGDAYFAVVHYGREGNLFGAESRNISPPSSDVCQAKCGDGTCQASQAPKNCKCSNSIPNTDIPTCMGKCVISCPRPFHLNDDDLWNESCSGNAICLCTNKGRPATGVKPGAFCQ